MPLKVFSRSYRFRRGDDEPSLLTLTFNEEQESEARNLDADAWLDLLSHIAQLARVKQRLGTVPDDREIFYRGAWRTRREFKELRSYRLRTFQSYLDGDSGLHGP